MLTLDPIAYHAGAFAPLLADAQAGDGGFMARLRDGWLDGTKRFDRAGEVLLGGWLHGRLVAVGGITFDPYHPAPDLGRVRHFYVMREARGRGGGGTLLARLVAHGAEHFGRLRLLTNNPAAARMYERGGFERWDAPRQTHRLLFGPAAAVRTRDGAPI